MKELSIEEKAKRYDEAIKKAETFYDRSQPISGGNIIIESIFHELKENEDERIRKEIIDYIKTGAYNTDWIVWLEKQSEKDEEILVLKDQIESLHAAIKAIKETHRIKLEKQGEQKPAELDENGESILTPFEAELFSMMSDAWQGYQRGEEVNIARIVKEHSAELLEMANEQKPVEWSEEDRIKCNGAIHLLENLIKEGYFDRGSDDVQVVSDLKFACKGLINWLKSLRPKNRWKPSDEQMRVLDLAIRGGIYRGTFEEITLMSLFKDLKDKFL